MTPGQDAALEVAEREHQQYHETGMCYGDSHAHHLAKIDALRRGFDTTIVPREADLRHL